jgi:hypothetical protein
MNETMLLLTMDNSSQKMAENEKRMPTFTDDCSDVIWPNLQNGEKPLIFVTHDESIFHVFDGLGRQWLPTGK